MVCLFKLFSRHIEIALMLNYMLNKTDDIWYVWNIDKHKIIGDNGFTKAPHLGATLDPTKEAKNFLSFSNQ